MVVHLALGVLFGLVVPPLEKLDEFIHWDYVRYLRQERHLPDQRDPYIQEHPWEYHQPPLYYLTAALISSPIPFSNPPMSFEPVNRFGFAFLLSSIPDNANGTLHDPANLAFPWHGDWLSLHVLRLYSILLSTATLIPMFWLAHLIFGDERLALGAVGWLAFRPSVLSINSTLSNDPMLLLCGTGILALCAGIIVRGPTWRRTIGLGVLLGLTALVKHTWPATVVAVPVAFVLTPRLRLEWRSRLAQLAAAAGIALPIGGWWFARNLILYGDFTGMSLGAYANLPDRPAFLPLRSSPPTWAEAGRVAWETFRRYWAHYGVVGMPDWINVLLVVLSVLLIGGLLYLLLTRRLQAVVASRRAAVFALLVTLFYLIQIAVFFAVSANGGQVRYVYAGFGAMAVVSQLGLLGILKWLLRGRAGESLAAAIIPVAVLIPLSLYGALGVLRPAYDLPRLVSNPAQLAEEYDQPAYIRFGGTITLFGYRIEPRVAHPGDTIWVTLCWQSGGPLEEALPYGVHIVDQDDAKIGERNTHPGLGMYPTLYWQAGVAFCDHVRVPLSREARTPEVYRVTLRYFHEDTLAVVPATFADGTTGEMVVLGEVAVLPRQWPSTGPIQYYLGDELTVTSLEMVALPSSDHLAVHVRWFAPDSVTRDYTAFVHVLDQDGQLVAQTDVRPLEGRFPTSYWPSGAVVEDTLTVPLAGLPPGNYRVLFGMYESQTVNRLMIYTSTGEGLQDNLVELGIIEVE
jgi:4-amino-4-deoxy-L-arabinose transferase-like glycosyltransferase